MGETEKSQNFKNILDSTETITINRELISLQVVRRNFSSNE